MPAGISSAGVVFSAFRISSRTSSSGPLGGVLSGGKLWDAVTDHPSFVMGPDDFLPFSSSRMISRI